MRSSGKRGAQTLKHLLVVQRERDDMNYIVNEEVHALEGIGKQPKRIPVKLISDDPAENMAVFRGFFKNNILACGSKYGEEKAKRYFEKGQMTEPYEVDCNNECPIWKKGECNLVSTLYLRLNTGTEHDNALTVARVKGIHSQRRLKASMNILYHETKGVLANIPLVLVFQVEKKRTLDGQTRNIPMLSLEPDGDLRASVMAELRHRAEWYELENNKPHTSIADLKIDNVLTSVISRDAALDPEEFEQPEENDGETFSEEPDLNVTDEVKKLLEGYPQGKADALAIKFSKPNGDIDIGALKKFVEKDKEGEDDLPF